MPTVAALRALLRSTAPPVKSEQVSISTGITALDQLLPDHGFQPGSLVEWLSDAAAGSATLAYHAIPGAVSSGGTWCVVDPQHTFCPAPLFSHPENPRCLVVRPQNWKDTCWTVEQVLRCEGIAATWLWTEEIISDLVLRRWKLAAEQGGGLGMLFRPLSAARQASWADVRWRVESRGSEAGRESRVESREPEAGRESRVESRESEKRKRRMASSLALDSRLLTLNSSLALDSRLLTLNSFLALDSRLLTLDPLRRWRVELVSCKGCFAQGRADLEQDHATGRVHLAAELAHPAAAVG